MYHGIENVGNMYHSLVLHTLQWYEVADSSTCIGIQCLILVQTLVSNFEKNFRKMK